LGEKTRETIFPEKHELFKQKCWEKNVPKGGKKRFLNSHEYRDEKMGGVEMRETIFTETHEWFEQKCWEKNRRHIVQKTFFYIHTNNVTKKVGGGKTHA